LPWRSDFFDLPQAKAEDAGLRSSGDRASGYEGRIVGVVDEDPLDAILPTPTEHRFALARSCTAQDLLQQTSRDRGDRDDAGVERGTGCQLVSRWRKAIVQARPMPQEGLFRRSERPAMPLKPPVSAAPVRAGPPRLPGPGHAVVQSVGQEEVDFSSNRHSCALAVRK
jgi:hypothetical protein